MPKSQMLFTIGYEGIPIDEFVEKIKESEIDVVIDVREIPWSRKNGFSRKALTEHFKKEKITYLNFPELGSPSPTRNKLRSNNDYAEFFQTCSIYLDQYPESLMDILTLLSAKNVCVMCYEANVEKCHRKVIVEKLQKLSQALHVKHL